MPASEEDAMPDKDSQMSRLRDYAWSHFSYHAEQRMKCFNFFVLLIGVVTTGLCSLFAKVDKPTAGVALLFIMLGLLVCVCAVTFRYLDKRNQQLVNFARDALKVLDDAEFSKVDSGIGINTAVKQGEMESDQSKIKLMAIDDEHRNANLKRNSHGRIFEVFFAVCGIYGVLIVMFGIYLGIPG